MHRLLTAALVCMVSLVATAQEKPVPKDSIRVTVPGCVRGRAFTVASRETPEPVAAEIVPGRRFRLNGKKKMLEEMNEQKGMMVEVTGLVRRGQLKETGIGIAGGRVRIGGGNPQAPIGAGAGRDPMYDVPGFDVESWRPLPDACPLR